MTREYRARHAFPVGTVKRPYVIVRKGARHSAVQTVGSAS